MVTKVGFRRGDDKSWHPAYSASDLTSSVHDNLKNLGLDTLPIVNLRCGTSRGPNEDSIAERLAVLVDLKRQGLVRHIGLSNVTFAQYEEARAMTEIVCVQNLYNVANRADDALIAEAGKARRRLRAVLPAGRLLTGAVVGAQRGRRRRSSATPMQVALAWLLERSPNILPIPGTSSVEHLRENLAAAKLRLSATMLEEARRNLGSITTLTVGSPTPERFVYQSIRGCIRRRSWSVPLCQRSCGQAADVGPRDLALRCSTDALRRELLEQPVEIENKSPRERFSAFQAIDVAEGHLHRPSCRLQHPCR